MNKDQVKGTVKDVTGKIERKTGELTDNPKMQIKGAAKQVEGKLQHAVGNVKEANKKAHEEAAHAKPPQRAVDDVDADLEEEEEVRQSRG